MSDLRRLLCGLWFHDWVWVWTQQIGFHGRYWTSHRCRRCGAERLEMSE